MAEKIDFENLFDEGDDHQECLWLSSDNASPTSFFEEYRSSTSLKFCVDEWLISWLSILANSYLHLDEGSSTLRHENESRVVSSSEDLISDEENQAGLELESPWNSHQDSRSCFESFASCSSLSSQISDSDRLSFSISLVNLDDAEDNNWISEAELESFQSDFPSPSWKSNWVGSEFVKSSKIDNHSDQKDLSPDRNDIEGAELQEIFGANNDEPLFWPFDLQKIRWKSEETWKFFSMSPRKNTIKLGTPPGSHSRPVKSEFQALKMNSKEACKRGLLLRTGSAASKILALKQRKVGNNNVKRSTRNMPSRLRKSNKILIQDTMDRNEGAQKQDDGFALSDEFPIETMLGLDEFDGHEGIDGDFNEEIFSFEDSL